MNTKLGVSRLLRQPKPRPSRPSRFARHPRISRSAIPRTHEHLAPIAFMGPRDKREDDGRGELGNENVCNSAREEGRHAVRHFAQKRNKCAEYALCSE